MNHFAINVNRIEEFQMTENIRELDKIFTRAKSTIVNGEEVYLVRGENGEGKFDTLTSLEELEVYKKAVYKYL